jgi:capsular exopolysaccharide synthesis family protein
MSEIFRWLKKTELERKRIIPEPSGPAIELAEDDHPPTLHVDGSTLPGDNGHPAGTAIRTDARFDLAGADASIKVVLDPLTDVGEQYRLLRAKLSLMQKQRGIKTLLVTSTVPSEGKTFTACCLAGVFAQEPGKRVLLIDADLRRPKAARDLGLVGNSEMSGLSQVLRGEVPPQEVMLSSNSLNFYLMPAGSVPSDPAELLSSPLLEQTVSPLRDGFDWIVFDSPPVLALADASLLAPLCDAVLLVVRTDSTPVKLVKEAIARLGADKICGIIMNRGRRRDKSNYYYYKYYRKSTQGKTAKA